MIEVIDDDGFGLATINWSTYSEIMRERYEDGKRETWNVLIGGLNSIIKNTTNESEIKLLEHTREILKEVLRAYRPESVE